MFKRTFHSQLTVIWSANKKRIKTNSDLRYTIQSARSSDQFVPLAMKGFICYFLKCQMHPVMAKETNCRTPIPKINQADEDLFFSLPTLDLYRLEGFKNGSFKLLKGVWSILKYTSARGFSSDELECILLICRQCLLDFEAQKTQTICIKFVQSRPNVLDAGPTLYNCYTNVLCSLGDHLDRNIRLHIYTK